MDIGGVLLAICGFSVVCLGLLALAAVVIARFTGRNFVAPFLRQDDYEEEILRPTPGRRSVKGRSSLRATRSSLDFDEAIERHRQGEGEKPKFDSQPPSPRQLGGASRFGEQLGSRRTGSQSRKRQDDTYEIYDDEEGFVDEY